MKKAIPLIIAILAFATIDPAAILAQNYNRLSIPFTVDEQQLPMALTGGLNAPQFSAADMDQDGDQDLFCFDRAGDVMLAFRRSGNGYTYDPGLLLHFPTDLRHWVLLRDFNMDGIMDMFAYPDGTSSGIRVYKGYWENGLLAFERILFDLPFPGIINFQLNNGSFTNLFVSQIDIPAIADMDCDGDLDILTFESNGGYIDLFTNLSQERGYGFDTLIFRLEENCWGGIYESGISTAVDLSEEPGGCYENFLGNIDFRHAGSTLCTFDGDADGDQDLLLGDLSFDYLNYLTNGGNCEQAWITSQDQTFPSYNVPLNLPIYPAAFYVDVDGDNVRDLLVSPNEPVNVENKKVVWYYRNEGADNSPNFNFQQQDFLVDKMLDQGSFSRPVIVDYNADGLLDIVVGNKTFYRPFGERDASLYLYENTGSASSPAYALVDTDYLGLNQFSGSANTFSPAFGDLDQDGDLDILIGDNLGNLFFGENIAGPGQPLNFGPWQYSYQDLNAVGKAVPAIGDVNRDGLADILIGNQGGNIFYFQNQGTPGNPIFNNDPNASPNQFALGGVDTRVFGSSLGNSAPTLLEVADKWWLFTGSRDGHIEVFNAIDDQWGAEFTPLTENLGNLNEGTASQVAVADLNGDGWLDIVIGNQRGGLGIYRTSIALDGTVPTVEATTATPNIFPNPANNQIHIEWSGAVVKDFSFDLFDANGRLILNKRLAGGTATVSIPALPDGLYLLRLGTKDGVLTKRIIIQQSR